VKIPTEPQLIILILDQKEIEYSIKFYFFASLSIIHLGSLFSASNQLWLHYAFWKKSSLATEWSELQELS